MKPIIGIVTKPLLNAQMKRTLWSRIIVNDEFRQLVVEFGGIPIGIMPNKFYGNKDTDNSIEILSKTDKEDLYSILCKCDGIILQGGLTSDTYEVEIVRYAIENNIPIIGICAGFNNIARTVGLPLIYKGNLDHIHNVYDKDYRHNVYLNVEHPLYSIFDKKVYEVNSLHSQFVELEDANKHNDIEVLATSVDNSNKVHVEAFTVKNTKFCLAIKWHPEIMLDSPETKNIFHSFMKQCYHNET